MRRAMMAFTLLAQSWKESDNFLEDVFRRTLRFKGAIGQIAVAAL
jgi:hypothetical protein